MRFHNESAVQQPSVREFKQFVSPSPKVLNKILLFHETSTTDLRNRGDSFAAINNMSGLCAVIIDTTACPHIRDESYLTQAKKEIAVPFLRQEDMTEIDHIFDSRLMQFDGHITSAKHFDKKGFYNLFKFSLAQDLLLIPLVSQKEDWEKILPVGPKVICIANDIGERLPPMVTESQLCLLGRDDLQEKYKLKCVIEEWKEGEPT